MIWKQNKIKIKQNLNRATSSPSPTPFSRVFSYRPRANYRTHQAPVSSPLTVNHDHLEPQMHKQKLRVDSYWWKLQHKIFWNFLGTLNFYLIWILNLDLELHPLRKRQSWRNECTSKENRMEARVYNRLFIDRRKRIGVHEF